MVNNLSDRQNKIEFLAGLQAGTRQIDEAFYIEMGTSKTWYDRLTNEEKEDFVKLKRKINKKESEDLTDDEKLRFLRLRRKMRAGDDY